MKEHRIVKPVVEFTELIAMSNYGNKKRVAILEGVRGHPRLGDVPMVRTSQVLNVDDEDNPTVIETLNTIYKLTS